MKIKKVVEMTLVGLISLGIVSSAGANGLVENIKAQIDRSIKFTLDGQKWQPNNPPIVYNGTTYVPLKEVSNALNTAASFDSKTKTIALGEKDKPLSIFERKFNYYYDSFLTVDKQYTLRNGIDYKKGLVFNHLNILVSNFYIFPESNYQTLTLNVMPINNIKPSSTIIVYIKDENGVVLKTVEMDYTEAKDITVDIGGLKKIEIAFKGDDSYNGIFVVGSYK